MGCGLMKECVMDAEVTVSHVDTSTLFSKVPFNRLLGMQREFCEAGQARMMLETRAELTNNFHATHGGVIMTMLDVVMSSAALSKSGFQRAVVTIDMSTSFLKPGRGRLTAYGTAVGGGRSVCFCEARIEDEAGDIVAKAMGTFKYVQP
jgi:uncharacterized protein (TIGR00369 family)